MPIAARLAIGVMVATVFVWAGLATRDALQFLLWQTEWTQELAKDHYYGAQSLVYFLAFALPLIALSQSLYALFRPTVMLPAIICIVMASLMWMLVLLESEARILWAIWWSGFKPQPGDALLFFLGALAVMAGKMPAYIRTLK